MATSAVNLPPGFVLDGQDSGQSLPPGFVLDTPVTKPRSKIQSFYNEGPGALMSSLNDITAMPGAVSGMVGGPEFGGVKDLLPEGVKNKIFPEQETLEGKGIRFLGIGGGIAKSLGTGGKYLSAIGKAKILAKEEAILGKIEQGGKAILDKENEVGSAIDNYINSNKGYQVADLEKYHDIMQSLPKDLREHLENIPGAITDAKGKIIPTLKRLREMSREAKNFLNTTAYKVNKVATPATDTIKAFRSKVSDLIGDTDEALKPLNAAYKNLEDHVFELKGKLFNERGGVLTEPARKLQASKDLGIQQRLRLLSKDVPEVGPLLKELKGLNDSRAKALFMQRLGSKLTNSAIPIGIGATVGNALR